MTKFSLQKEYPETFRQLIEALVSRTVPLLKQCNETTAHAPIQVLKRVSEQDQEITRTVITPLICNELMRVYELFHKDGMLQDDIFQLIKVLATIPGNTYFDQHFMPQVYQSLQNFGVALK